MLRGVSAIVTRLPLPFIPDALDEIFVEVTDVQVPYLMGRDLKSVLACEVMSLLFWSGTGESWMSEAGHSLLPYCYRLQKNTERWGYI